MLKEKILNRQRGIVVYSLTPPKITTDPERIKTIAQNQAQRIKTTGVDGLILYDIQDEAQRTEKERTFSFIPTITPEVYGQDYLGDVGVPKIIYKSIANLTRQQFENWLLTNSAIEYSVFVGASSRQQIEATGFSLKDAYELRKRLAGSVVLGGVAIPERHASKRDEHERLFAKAQQGCSFFVSQCVYSLNDAKNFLSDYYYATLEKGLDFSPILFTLSPCGSLKTLQFMEWLGIEVPRWLYNDLKNAKDILATSVNTCNNIATELLEYATKKSIPIGFNVESISIKKEEIDASLELLDSVIKLSKSS